MILARRSSGLAITLSAHLPLGHAQGEAGAYGRGLKGVGLGRFSPDTHRLRRQRHDNNKYTQHQGAAVAEVVFTDAERVALAGFLAGYRGLARNA